MPPGVYERKPYMRTYGKTAGKRGEMLALRKSGVSITTIMRMYGVSAATVCHLQRGNWK